MKLLKHEQEDLIEALHSIGVDEHFHFVKKKGWVVILNPHKVSDEFSFHRKKSLSLIDGNFKDELIYYVKVNGRTQEFSTWPEVCKYFKHWLDL
jgi:hypothetical protein